MIQRADRYKSVIWWDADDGLFIAEAPELKGCSAHGETQEQAFIAIRGAVAAWLKVADELGRPIPEPHAIAA